MRIKLSEWIITILAFILFFYFYAIFSYFGVEDFIEEGVLKEYFETNLWHVEIIISGILFGILFNLINLLTDNKIFRKKSYGFNILLKSVLYLIALVCVVFLIFKIFLWFELIPEEQLLKFANFISLNFVLSGFLYYSLFILLLNFILFINKKLGPGSLFDLLTGKYHLPRNEKLIFMFLDLKESTALAEKLGHKKYSSFIKECIHELTPIIQKHNARVYQYVGDEVVLYWKMKEGFRKRNCLKTFFKFLGTLKKREAYFASKYGEVPTFKAGMDAGTVTATEIGDIKREIAFHGDVLNTSSRLEQKCNEYNEQLIISQHIADHIQSNKKYHIEFLSDLPLKGKSENIKFYSVRLKPDPIK